MCPAQARVLSEFARPPINISALLKETAILILGKQKKLPDAKKHLPDEPPQTRVFTVAGIKRAEKILDLIENGRYDGPPVVELYGCEGGCFGSPMLSEDAGIAAMRVRNAFTSERGGKVVRREKPLTAVKGLALAGNLTNAAGILERVKNTAATLPGRDCAMCGSPDCATFAEDVVLMKAAISDCPYYAVGERKTNET